MNDLRVKIQTKLNELTSVTCGVPIPDGMIETGKTYFGYELQETYVDSDFDRHYTMSITLTGRIVRKEVETENTLQIMDTALEQITNKLKELNFKCSYNDISFDDGIRKTLVKADAKYNELNNKFIR